MYRQKMFGNRKKIGLALGGGGTKGLIHIGVLRYLEEHDYTIKEIAGTSIGSLIGVLVALGKKSDEIYDLVAQIDNSDIIDIDRKNISIGGKNIIKKLQEIAGDTLIEDLPIPITAIATDLDSGSEIVIDSGPVIDAVRYSISVPGVFSLHDEDKPIVDGGIINNLPVNHLSTKYIIASSCRGYGGFSLDTKKTKVLGIEIPNNHITHKKDILIRSLTIMMRQIEDLHLRECTHATLIRPYTGDISAYDMDVLDTAVERGYEEAKRTLG